jgi:DNA-binding NarL/FixJ family response regulator
MSSADNSKGIAQDAHRFKVLPLHPDPLVRAGIVASLRRHATFEVVEDGLDGATPDAGPIAVVVADYHQALQLADGAVPTERRSLAMARILALTTSDGEADIRRALHAGVHGYLLRGEPLNELIEGVTALAHGGRYLSRSIAQRLMDSLTPATLTAREMDVLQLVAAGESNKAVARELQIEIGTVKSHMNAILAKLNATSRTQAAAIARTRGLLEHRLVLPRLLHRVPYVAPMTQKI